MKRERKIKTERRNGKNQVKKSGSERVSESVRDVGKSTRERE